MNARMQAPGAWYPMFRGLSLFLATTLVCAIGWAKQTPDTQDLTALGANSLEVLDTGYRQPTPEFVCGSAAVLQYPKEFRRRPQAAVVDLEFTRTAQGFARDYFVTRETHPAFAREAIRYLRRCRFAPLPMHSYGHSLRLLYKFSSTERGTTLYLKKLKHSARRGTPGRKRFYAYNVELATSFDKIPRAAEANRWYLKAATAGDAKAQYQVGLRLFYGKGFGLQPKLGIQWLQQAAAGGSGGANFALAQMDTSAVGAVSAEQRLAYLRAAVAAEHTGAALALARGLLSQLEPDQNTLTEVGRLLKLSKTAWDKETWLLVAARRALAAGQQEQAAKHVAAARQYVTEIGHPLAEVEQLEQALAVVTPAI